jgi:hypothetical protein
MSEEGSSARSIPLGGRNVPVVDPYFVQPVSADLIVESREFNGTAAISFASLVVTPTGETGSIAEAVVCARLRLTLPTAIDLRNMLDEMLKASMPPKSETH